MIKQDIWEDQLPHEPIQTYVFELRDAFDAIMKKYDASPVAMLSALQQMAEDEANFQQDIDGRKG